MKEGAFWVIAKNEQGLRNGEFDLLTHFVRDDSHVNIWPKISRQRTDLSRFQYDHFSRGRVWINDSGLAIILINLILDNPIVIDRIKTAFELTADAVVCHDGVPAIRNFLR
ncbi:hypothetical protein EOM82_01685 [bacterium]|nr:hypothetical protein [bacterium]